MTDLVLHDRQGLYDMCDKGTTRVTGGVTCVKGGMICVIGAT